MDSWIFLEAELERWRWRERERESELELELELELDSEVELELWASKANMSEWADRLNAWKDQGACRDWPWLLHYLLNNVYELNDLGYTMLPTSTNFFSRFMMIYVAGAVLMSIVLVFRFSLVSSLGRVRDIGKQHRDERGPEWT